MVCIIKSLTVILFSTLVLVGCGSDRKTQSKTTPNNSDSNNLPTLEIPSEDLSLTVNYLYPPNYSYVGNVNNLDVQLQIKASIADELLQITAVQIDGTYPMELNEGVWKTINPVVLTGTPGPQTLKIGVLLDDGTQIELDTLKIDTSLNSITAQQIGKTDIAGVTGVTINNEGVLFFSDAKSGTVYQYDAMSAASKKIYSATTSGADTLNWPIAAQNKIIYLIQDSNLELNPEASLTSLITIDLTTDDPSIKSYQIGGENFQAAKGILLDLDGQSQHSTGVAAVFSLDPKSQNPFYAWYFDNETFQAFAPLVSPDDQGNRINPELTPLALAGFLDSENIQVAVLQQNLNTPLVANPSVFFIDASESPLGIRYTAKLAGSYQQIFNPSAMTFSSDGSEIFIAADNQLWAVDVATFEARLVSSSDSISQVIGSGEPIPARTRALAAHPTQSNLLYAATGSSVIVFDLNTGNRALMIR